MTNLSTETLFDETETANSKQIAILKKHFPQCFDKDGHFQPEKMMEVVKANEVDMVKESYSLNWLGKAYARLLTNLPPQKLLKPDTTHNESAENSDSGNILIKGDNLEVLKHLVNGYREKIKMIYIDPPYNTGSDGFVYQDNFKFTVDDLSRLAGIDKAEAERILSFNAKGSNSHSAWLTFMYPRLYIARELMREDGVIFISIDDNEQAQLKLLCDEIFGEENYVATMPWKGRGGGADDKRLLQNHEYVLFYAKNIDWFVTGRKIKDDEKFTKYDDNKGRYYKTQLARKWGNNSRREDRPNLFYSVKTKDGIEIYPKLPNGDDGCWRWKKSGLELAIENDDVEFSQRSSDGAWEIYEKIYEPIEGEYRTKLYSSWLQDEIRDDLLDLLEEHDPKTTAYGTKEVKQLFEGIKAFSYPKPTVLINILMKISGLTAHDSVLDFFAGSGTTADAVMQINTEENVNIKFISVQVDESTDPKKESFKAGYETIFDITKARITKAAQKIAKENPNYQGNLGFKIFETTDNFRPSIDDELQVSNESLFDDMVLSDEQYQALLTTWMLYDNNVLTADIISIDLQGYNAELVNKNLYLIASGFGTQNLKCLLDRLDEDKSFAPDRIIVNGYNFDTAIQMELNEAIKSYQNKKKITINIIVRY